jgi:cob(I)alamin adenosyltransferase
MVFLNRIYTRSGDEGETGLGDGSRISKTHPRIAAYGTVDELNSVIGLALASTDMPEPYRSQLLHIQNDLFDIGADLCVPEPAPDAEPPEHPVLRATAVQVERLENWIDAANAHLSPLNSFVLPGGSPASAHLHVARTVCRRAEIACLHLAEFEAINSYATIYLNRLSDLLFVFARVANDNGAADVLWIPGGSRQSPA